MPGLIPVYPRRGGSNAHNTPFKHSMKKTIKKSMPTFQEALNDINPTGLQDAIDYVNAWKTGRLAAEPTPFPLVQQRQLKKHPPIHDEDMSNDYFWETQVNQRQVINDLKSAAFKGNRQAVNLLIQVAWDSVQALDSLAREWPELLRPAARKQIMWPAFIGKKKALSGEKKGIPKERKKGYVPPLNGWLINTIELGEESPHKGKWSPHSPATTQAIAMFHWLDENKLCLGLPDLTENTKSKWFSTGWDGLLKATNQHPEFNDFLRLIGLHYAQHSVKNAAQKRAGKKTQDSNIKTGIRKQIRQSFMNYWVGKKKE